MDTIVYDAHQIDFDVRTRWAEETWYVSGLALRHLPYVPLIVVDEF